jgi:hypothetical protein
MRRQPQYSPRAWWLSNDQAHPNASPTSGSLAAGLPSLCQHNQLAGVILSPKASGHALPQLMSSHRGAVRFAFPRVPPRRRSGQPEASQGRPLRGTAHHVPVREPSQCQWAHLNARAGARRARNESESIRAAAGGFGRTAKQMSVARSAGSWPQGFPGTDVAPARLGAYRIALFPGGGGL